MSSIVRMEFVQKLPRKMRRAMCSRRWEKKVCKALSASLGYKITAIRFPEFLKKKRCHD